jgi:hypothetical protein
MSSSSAETTSKRAHIVDQLTSKRAHIVDQLALNSSTSAKVEAILPVKRGRWDKDESKNLVEAVKLHRTSNRKGGISWDLVSKHFDGTRTATQCRDRWLCEKKSVLCPEEFTPPVLTEWPQEMEQALEVAVSKHRIQSGSMAERGCVRWQHVSSALGDVYSAKQCRYHWQSRSRGASGPWTEEEDCSLLDALRIVGDPSEPSGGPNGSGVLQWKQVQNKMNTERTPQQCRNRWVNTLKHRAECTTAAMLIPTSATTPHAHSVGNNAQGLCAAVSVSMPVRRGPWSSEEDEQLLAGVRASSSAANSSRTKQSMRPQRCLYWSDTGRVSWREVAADYLQGRRSAQQCLKRYKRLSAKLSGDREKPNEEEDEEEEEEFSEEEEGDDDDLS